ncbi:MAG TPA: ribosome maturation factor RimM, partial [Thermoanaerobaculia bacterium]|nr:ribosome maturation factor RimM [Thermoanaerobaculia bacterium]
LRKMPAVLAARRVAEEAMSLSPALPDSVVVGRVVRPHGLAGELVVVLETDVEERFAPGSTLHVGTRGRQVEVLGARPFGDRMLVRFAGVEDRTAAEALRGVELTVPRHDVPEAPAGSFYHFELLDCSCHDAREGDLGRVIAIHQDGGGYLLEVQGEARRLLVPFVETFVVRVDVFGRRIELDLPPGLVDLCAST